MAMSALNWRCKNCGHSYAVGQVSHPVPQHLLTTNNPPSETELVYLNDILPAATVEVAQELATLNDDIEALQKTLETLKARRPEFEARLLAYKSIISPVRRVPPEIVAEIIDLATVGRPVTLDTQKGIWSLSHVSHMWRSVALSNSFFWSTIYIEFSKLNDCAAERVQAILLRTDNHPLSFELFFGYGMKASQYVARIIIEEFVRHASQWCEASLTIPSSLVYTLAALKNHIPNLQGLHLGLYEDVGHLIRCITYFRNAPALRKVSFNSFLLHPQLFPWSQITEYSAGYSSGSCMRSLKLLPNLLDLRLDQQYSDGTTALELKKLCRLDVSQSENLISHLTLPSLQELIVPLHSHDFPSIMNLINRSECRITALTFEGHLGDTDIVTDVYKLVEFFKSFPSLSVLNLSSHSARTITTICNLFVSDTADLLPILTELILPWGDFIRPLVSFLHGRRDNPSTSAIKIVRFTGPYHRLPPELQSLVHDGLNISFG